MGNLVVSKECGVDGRAAGEDVADDDLDLDLALHRGRVRPHQRVRPFAIDPRPHICPTLLACVPQLLDEVPEGEHQRASEVVRAREEDEIFATDRVGPSLCEHRAQGQQAVRCIA